MPGGTQIDVQVAPAFRSRLAKRWLRSLAASILTSEGAVGPLELSIVVTDDETVQRLNAQYLGEDHPTDVLSFPLMAGGEDFVMAPGQARHLGDVIVAYPTAQRQAAERGHSVQREVAHLLIHGILHLLGYDHAEPDEERVMQEKEGRLLALLRELAL